MEELGAPPFSCAAKVKWSGKILELSDAVLDRSVYNKGTTEPIAKD
jgi:hypothetical protein